MGSQQRDQPGLKRLRDAHAAGNKGEQPDQNGRREGEGDDRTRQVHAKRTKNRLGSGHFGHDGAQRIQGHGAAAPGAAHQVGGGSQGGKKRTNPKARKPNSQPTLQNIESPAGTEQEGEKNQRKTNGRGGHRRARRKQRQLPSNGHRDQKQQEEGDKIKNPLGDNGGYAVGHGHAVRNAQQQRLRCIEGAPRDETSARDARQHRGDRLSPGHVNAQRTVNDRLPPERFQRHVESGKEDGLDQKGPTQLPEAGDQAAEINLGCEPHQDNEAGTRKSPVQRAHPPRLRFFQRFLHYEPPRRRVKRTSVLRLRGEFGKIGR